MFLKKYNKIYLIHFGIFIFIGLFGIISTPIKEIISGIKNILSSGSILITDYMYVGGMGATLLNASITSLLTLLLYKITKINPNGSMIMSLWLTLGFSMIGKNFLNIWPTIIGVYIYSKFQKECFSNYILIAVLSTSLAPISLEIFRVLPSNSYLTLIVSNLISMLLGFLLAPLSKFTLKMHQGYNLYNVGFASGLISIIFISILKYFGLEFKTTFLWSTEYKVPLIILLMILFLILIIIGINKECVVKFSKILKHSGRTVTDYYLLYKDTSFLNMGILGILFLSYILLIDGDLNGAVIALLLCIVGFGAFGKNLFNVIPVVLGVILTAFIKHTPLNNPTILLSTLGSTALSPIGGQFGFLIGLISGFIHLTLITNIGGLSNGINLYNNGFIAGIVAIIMIPIIDGLKKGD